MIKKLNLIVEAVKFVYECEENQVRGIKDTAEKIIACYMAKRITHLHPVYVAKFFFINPHYMEKCIKNLSIEFLLSPEDKKDILDMEKFINKVEKITLNNKI